MLRVAPGLIQLPIDRALLSLHGQRTRLQCVRHHCRRRSRSRWLALWLMMTSSLQPDSCPLGVICCRDFSAFGIVSPRRLPQLSPSLSLLLLPDISLVPFCFVFFFFCSSSSILACAVLCLALQLLSPTPLLLLLHCCAFRLFVQFV